MGWTIHIKNEDESEPEYVSLDALDQNAVFASLSCMTPAKAEWYRDRAEDCCRNAITAESPARRLHWLEAAARWISFAREEGVLPPRRYRSSGFRNRHPNRSPLTQIDV
jgi:hypothetical protein